MQHGERPALFNDPGDVLLDLYEALMLRWKQRVCGKAFPVTFTRPGAEQIARSTRFRVLPVREWQHRWAHRVVQIPT